MAQSLSRKILVSFSKQVVLAIVLDVSVLCLFAVPAHAMTKDSAQMLSAAQVTAETELKGLQKSFAARVHERFAQGRYCRAHGCECTHSISSRCSSHQSNSRQGLKLGHSWRF